MQQFEAFSPVGSQVRGLTCNILLHLTPLTLELSTDQQKFAVWPPLSD
jgi:hypothetical protein